MNISDFTIHPTLIVKETLDPGWCWTSAARSKNDFLFWYIYENQIKIETEEEVFTLKPGDTYLFDLAKYHHCTHDPNAPAGLYYAQFDCDQAPALRERMHRRDFSTVLHPARCELNMHLMEESLKISNSMEETEIWLAPVLQQILAGRADTPDRDPAIAAICREMDSRPQMDYPLEALARQAGYSKNQFLRLFRQTAGMTPHNYLLNARMAKAKNLLLFSNYSVTQIAQLLGYYDLNHFSSQFRARVGVSPTEYLSGRFPGPGCQKKGLSE